MMRNIFKRRRPVAAHRVEPVEISPADRLIAAYSGYTPEQWAALPALVQKDKREQVVWEMRSAS